MWQRNEKLTGGNEHGKGKRAKSEWRKHVRKSQYAYAEEGQGWKNLPGNKTNHIRATGDCQRIREEREP